MRITTRGLFTERSLHLFPLEVRGIEKITLGSLFDGIGGFPLAAQEHGIISVWASEIEKAPMAVTRRHFPGMKHLGDVIKVNGAEIEQVDIITFGSPCQDLSVAGKRQGLSGERSGLFMEAVRIIREMREATNGQYPAFAVWENVVGAFSSNGGRDFAAVLSALVGAEVGVPAKGWTRAGVAFGPLGQAAWRVFDAQFWGVPQRRRRIFLVADFGGQRAGQVLFEPYSLSWDSAEGREAGKGTTCGSETGVRAGGESVTFRSVAGTLRATAGMPKHQADWEQLVVSKTAMSVPRVAGTLMASGAGLSRAAGMVNEVDFLVPQVSVCLTAGTGRRMDAETETLIPISLSVSFGSGSFGAYREGIGTLRASGGDQGGGSESLIVSPQRNGSRYAYTVRRLMPVECERLMGFPDGWTEWGVDENGNRVELSDAARYKACGNSVAIPVVSWIMGRIAKVLRGESL